MARPRKPLESQTGNLTVNFQKYRKRAEGKMKAGEKDQLKTVHPDLINEDAIAYWETLTSYLESIDFYGNINVPDAVGYCNAYAMYLDAWRKLKRARKPEMKEAYTRMIKQYSEEMTRCQNRGGFSVSARLQIGEKAVKEETEDLTSKFFKG